MSHQYENESDPEELDSEELDSEELDSEELGPEESDLEESQLEGSDPEESDTEEQGDSEGNETRSDGDLRSKIFSSLKRIKTPNVFAHSAVDSFLPNPGLYLPPHGVLPLPLIPDYAQKIISQVNPSPGKEECWELNPDQFLLKNPAWNQAIKKILDTVITQFGLEKGRRKISTELYKLRLYDPGAFCEPQKDSEKAPEMFATLVVCLPSPHEGGKVVLTHDDETSEFETASSSDFNCSYAAWYSDVTFEVQPIVSGYRLMLVYNLIRQTTFKIPSHNLVRGRVKQLLTLLDEYNSQLEKKDDKLPPIFLHKLEYKYTQTDLKLDVLEPLDFAQVQTLAQLSTKIGFNIYLATLELEIHKDHFGDEDHRLQVVENIVDLNGKLVVESFDFPTGALLDPTPQDEGQVDEEHRESSCGKPYSPVTYWYRSTVVVLVPPSKQLEFVFKFEHNGSVIKPLFCKLMEDFSKDPAQKLKLKQLCELALKQEPEGHSYYHHEIPKSFPAYFQKAAATALDLGYIDVFEKMCKTIRDKILLDNAHMLGRWTAKKGVLKITDRLIKVLQIISSVAKKVEFLKSVTEGFESTVPEPNPAEKITLKQWSDEAIFTAVTEPTALSGNDGISLAQLSKTMNWSQFKLKAKVIISKAPTITKINFIKEFTSILPEFDEEHRSFMEIIIQNMWKEFVFDVKCEEPVPQITSSYSWHQSQSSNLVDKDDLNAKDIYEIVKITITILSSNCVETIIIPAMLTAIPVASKECTKRLFIMLVQMIIENRLSGFRLLTNDVVPPPSYRSLVLALLTKYLMENVSLEPQAPANWSLPAGSCNCKDCSVVNTFLQDPKQKSLDFRCGEARRKHLDKTFSKNSYSRHYTTTIQEDNYDITIVRGPTTIWQITKHRRVYEAAKSKWIKNINSVIETLSVLKRVEPVYGRLKAYLQPYYSVIMNADVRGLPDLKSLVTMPLSQTNEIAGPAHNQQTNQTSYKREASNIHTQENVKRMKP